LKAPLGGYMKLFERKKSNGTVWKVAGGMALAALAAGLIANFNDLRRLLKIHTM